MTNLQFYILVGEIVGLIAAGGLSFRYFRKAKKIRKENVAVLTSYQKISNERRDHIEKITKENETLAAKLKDLEERFRLNPSYDCQQFMADVMSGQGLFKIERIERENLFYYRR